MTQFDFVVVGSGATGVMAAQTLAEGGATVLVIDGGQTGDRYEKLVPDADFVTLRETDDEQYRYFLGERFESAAYRSVGAGAQLTPPRRFIVDGVDELLKTHAPTFAPIESLAVGGLASGWGLLCGVYSDAELSQASLPIGDMRSAYQTVADRIGISGAAGDDAQPYTYDGLQGIQPPVPLDPTAAAIADGYARRRASLQSGGYHLGRPALALLTQRKDDREPTALHDMDFYSDAGKSGWRPAIALNALRRRPNVSYVPGVFAWRFEEGPEGTAVIARDLRDGSERRFSGRRVVLACGTLGTARIVLRSLQTSNESLPMLCNPYTYAPCIVPSRLGQTMPRRNNSLVQLVVFHDPDGSHRDVAMGTIFTYRSLLLFRLMREMPLGIRDARTLMQYLLSGFVIVGIDHPQPYSAEKFIRLQRDAASPTGDALDITFSLTRDERQANELRERGFLRMLRSLGALPIKRVHPPLGASIHYAGTLPFSKQERRFALDVDGRLHGTRNIFVADGSGFTFLPAKGLTLSLMANAHRVGASLSKTAAC